MECAGKIYIGHNSDLNVFKIWNLSDWHYGNKACALKVLKNDIDTVANDPFSFAFLGGDLAEFIDLHDPRFDPKCVPANFTIEDYGDLGAVLMRRVRDLAWPMKGKLLGAVQGNHEENFMRRNKQEGLMNWLTTELGIRYLGYSALIDIVFIRNAKFGTSRILKIEEIREEDVVKTGRHSASFRVFIHHGFGNSLTEGGKLNTLIKCMERFQADIYTVGHVHDPSAKPIVLVGANETCTKLTDVYRAGLITGSYLKTYEQGCTNYGEKKGMRPVPLGARFIKVCPFTRQLRVEI
uniref:Calcineurin-like phosphoesterase n=2 Tax=viral metagenome TaxID=1070528 RepID=A0A6H2A1W9_9ZZZZ